MEDFVQDVFKHLENYYYSIVDLTPKFILAIVVILVSWFIATRIGIFAGNRLKAKMHDRLLAVFIARLIKSVLIIIGVLFMFKIIGLDGVAQSMLAGAGISAFVIGFALKDIGENFLAGILLAFKRPFNIGDIIESNGVKGEVINLNLRDTEVKSDSKIIYIPNALLIKNTLINYNSAGFLLQTFTVGLEYGSDYNRAIELVKEVLHKNEDVTDKDYADSAVITDVAAAGVIQLNIRYWVKTGPNNKNSECRSKIIAEVLNTLKENGFVLK
ncbi:mechanosensitive ion channel protein MscS [Flavobacterium crocinum]|uniref:Mechanosensitive ion channel protein MscS n=1 Tax=Flavobacterium crocinum TaxID=2183896 RepID=A0A2S1YS38_9FLAO|nr:mechanosensitive ion channel domain-containing protein [Flavobacterium crocinum]AWK06598.1 mechanosensitive ion channel protein MscS [Flavobacterium crocinum]